MARIDIKRTKRMFNHGRRYGFVTAQDNTGFDFRIQCLISAAKVAGALTQEDIRSIHCGFLWGREKFEHQQPLGTLLANGIDIDAVRERQARKAWKNSA